MKKMTTLLLALTMSAAVHAQEIEKIDKFASGYINGTYMNKYKTIDGVLYAVGYEGTKDWILVRYPAGSRATAYNVYLPETVSFIGEDAFAGCTSLQGIYFDDSSPTVVNTINTTRTRSEEAEEVARYSLSGRPCAANEKGIQIIVYADFTTKTVIIE